MAFTNNWDPSRLGQINKAGDAKALFLKKFAGEVITAFNSASVMMDKQVVRTIESGKSAQFPVTGQVSAGYHTAGESLLETDNGYLQKVGANEKIIYIDDMLVSPVFIANIDEAMNHYDVRSIYTKEVGYALAKQMDENLHQKLVMAARESATITGGNGGTVQDAGATVETDGSVLAGELFTAAESLDNNEVPAEDRYCIVRPAQYYNLVQATDTINRDWGGAGAYSEGKVFRVAGINIVKSTRLPSTDLSSAVTGDNNDYTADFSDTIASVFHKSAVGTVKLLDLATESEYQIANQGTLIVSKYAMGHGTLRPESSVEITKAV
tara:strand:+ start:8648 stop:9619 length:972 start_codon:yes stop_codon:yes gene_type:complete